MEKMNSLFLKSCLEAIKDAGIKTIVLSPGSRSTPLAILCHEEPNLDVYMDVDERSAAFFALGLAKVSQEPVVCICTSGSACANYFPAICEAMASEIPLIIFTTDRPHELRHVGAPQTMDQLSLFGNKVKFSMEFPIPDDSNSMCQYAYSQTFQLVSRSLKTPKGPVHANFPFREPLIPKKIEKMPIIKRKKIFNGIKQMNDIPDELVSLMNQEKGWLLIGEANHLIDLNPLVALAEKLNWPIFSDPLANVKSRPQTSDSIINHHDLIMNGLEFNKTNTPQVIVRIGRSLLSKSLNKFLDSFDGDYLLFDETGEIPDYSHQVSVVIDSNVNQFLTEMIKKVSSKQSDWLSIWKDLDTQANKELIESEAMTTFSEVSAIASILESLNDNSQLFISNSMPIRDVDTVLKQSNKLFSLYGNRGINGIDGIISSAFGMTASNKEHWNGLIIGDLSFFHSLNGLAIGKGYELPLTLFVINNDGGGIFSMLPQNELPQSQFEPLFGTPQSIDFKHIARTFDCDYISITNQLELEKALEQIMKESAFRIVEIKTSRLENTVLRKDLITHIKRKKND